MIICIPIDKTTLTVPSATSRSHCPGKTGYTQTSKNHCNVKKMFSWLFVNEGNPLLFLYLRGNNLEFGRECFCLLSTLRALNEIWFIRWSLRFFGDLATLYLTRENFHYSGPPSDLFCGCKQIMSTYSNESHIVRHFCDCNTRESNSW